MSTEDVIKGVVVEDSFYNEEDEDIAEDLLNHTFSDFVIDPTGDLYYSWQVTFQL